MDSFGTDVAYSQFSGNPSLFRTSPTFSAVTAPIADAISSGAFISRIFTFTNSTGVPTSAPVNTTFNSSINGQALRTNASSTGGGSFQWSAIYRFIGTGGTATIGSGSAFIGSDVTSSLSNTRFSIQRSSQNLASGNTANISLRAYDAAGQLGTTQTFAIDVTGAQTEYSFDFANLGGASAIQTSLGAVEIQLDFNTVSPGSAANFDFTTFQASAIPFDFEPSAGIAILGAGFGLNKLRKRVKANKETEV